MDVYVIGKATTPRILKNVKYDLVCDGLTNIMEIIQNAAFVMTPRSLCAHLAGGYKKKAFVWVPNDGENWHLNYPGWDHVCQRWEAGITPAKERLHEFLKANGLL
jgi:ADP-heptose:LPS heptosyltransferase